MFFTSQVDVQPGENVAIVKAITQKCTSLPRHCKIRNLIPDPVISVPSLALWIHENVQNIVYL